ncbi:MAG: VOC family protein [Mucilaginibacter sp.]
MTDFQTSIVPTLSVRNGPSAVEFYKNAFGAIEIMRISNSEEEIVAELSIGNARFFIADESPKDGNLSPATAGGVTIRIGLFVADPDAVTDNAVAAGARLLYPVADQEYGYRLGAIIDPYGHQWEIGKKLDAK